jgi:hypothetical protein
MSIVLQLGVGVIHEAAVLDLRGRGFANGGFF